MDAVRRRVRPRVRSHRSRVVCRAASRHQLWSAICHRHDMMDAHSLGFEGFLVAIAPAAGHAVDGVGRVFDVNLPVTAKAERSHATPACLFRHSQVRYQRTRREVLKAPSPSTTRLTAWLWGSLHVPHAHRWSFVCALPRIRSRGAVLSARTV